MAKFTIRSFNAMFPDDGAALDWLRDFLYPEGITCKLCKRVTKHYKVESRRSYSCAECGHHVHPTAGTIFHKSSTPLKTWFHAIYLIASSKGGISARRVQDQIGVTYKCAWRMCKQIRSMLDEDIGPLASPVEMDETYMGGRRKGKMGRPMRGDKTHTPVLGIAQRRGKAKAFAIETPDGQTLVSHALAHIEPNAIVYTDQWQGYRGLAYSASRFDHRTIRHRDEYWVDGDRHTNNVEGLWSLIKRGINGSYRHVSKKYLQHYLNEFTFRWNHRKDERPTFLSALDRLAAKRA